MNHLAFAPTAARICTPRGAGRGMACEGALTFLPRTWCRTRVARTRRGPRTAPPGETAMPRQLSREAGAPSSSRCQRGNAASCISLHTTLLLYGCQLRMRGHMRLADGGTITHYRSVIAGSARAAAPIGPQPVGATSLIRGARPRRCPEIPPA